MQGYEPFLFRAIALKDLDTIYAFSKLAHLTNLPRDRALSKVNIQHSLHAFERTTETPGPEDFYFFVIENIETNALIGCCAIYADVGNTPPFYSFQWNKNNESLLLSTDIRNVSELAALYLSPEHRMHHMGAFLSRARYLWIASHPNRFHDTVMAEMHGRTDKNNHPPFWDAVIQPFMENKTFEEADLALAAHHPAFIRQYIPHTPISLKHIDKRARACVGIPHKTTRAAMQLLMHEGFAKTQYVNIFDGAPILIAKTKDIKTIRTSMTLSFAGIKNHAAHTAYLISTTTIPFYVALATVEVDTDNHCCYLTADVAKKLSLTVHDKVRLALF